MYLPPHFNKSHDSKIAARIVREHPFASLISNDDEGFPYVTHLPLHLVEDEAQGGVDWKILGHVAKPNPHWKYLAARPQALVTFLGPQAYMSPKVYPDLARVPTWNYLAVHCKVSAALIEEPEAKDRLLKTLIGDHEPPYKQQWIDLGQEYQHKMLAGIVAFELKVT
jgi:transcriptional regulator